MTRPKNPDEATFTVDDIRAATATLESENTKPRLVLVVFKELPDATACTFVPVRCDRCRHYSAPKFTAPAVCYATRIIGEPLAPDWGCPLFEERT